MEWVLAHATELAALATIAGTIFAGFGQLHKSLIRSMALHFASQKDVQTLGHKIDHLQKIVLSQALVRQEEQRHARNKHS
jgi:hypothetical protein